MHMRQLIVFDVVPEPCLGNPNPVLGNHENGFRRVSRCLFHMRDGIDGSDSHAFAERRFGDIAPSLPRCFARELQDSEILEPGFGKILVLDELRIRSQAHLAPLGELLSKLGAARRLPVGGKDQVGGCGECEGTRKKGATHQDREAQEAHKQVSLWMRVLRDCSTRQILRHFGYSMEKSAVSAMCRLTITRNHSSRLSVIGNRPALEVRENHAKSESFDILVLRNDPCSITCDKLAAG